MIFWIALLIQTASAQWFDQGWNLELAFGTTNHEITNPNNSKAVYDGYGGHALVYYPLFQNENFSFGPQGKYFYSELNNKANTTLLSEEIRYYGLAPGLELRVSYFLVGYNFKYQWLSVDMSGTFNNKTSSSFSSPEFYVGLELPLENWAFRLYYSRSEAELSSVDTGLSTNSPWAEENVYLAIRYRFGKRTRSPYERDFESSEVIGPRIPPARRSFRVTPSDSRNYLND